MRNRKHFLWTLFLDGLFFILVFALAIASIKFARGGDLPFTLTPPNARTDGTPLAPSEIDHYNGIVRNALTDIESTFVVPGNQTGFTLPGLVAGDYCVKLSTTDNSNPPLTDGYSNEVCKNVPAGPLQPPNPPILHGATPPESSRLPRMGWSLAVDNFENGNPSFPAELAIDGDPGTFWHTEYQAQQAPHPHAITVDMGTMYWVTGIQQQPRLGGTNGTIKGYTVGVSSDGSAWNQVAAGDFPPGGNLQEVTFSPVRARYVKLTATSNQTGLDNTAVAEIYILGY